MSIIERVAELLAPAARSDQGQTSTPEESDLPGLDVVERAVGEGARGVEVSENRSAATLRETKSPAPQPRSSFARSSSVTTRTLTIGLEQLRRQNMILADENRTPIAEAFRRIKRRILLNLSHPKPGTHPNLVMVTSSLPGEGKSFCAINLALSIALERDYSALLVDGDVARPSLPGTLGVETDRGLMDVLLERHVHLSEVLFRTDIEKLMLLPAGTLHRHATEVLSSGAMRGLLRELSEDDPNRVVIFDSPPILAASEASVLASQMGQIVVVVEAGKTTESALKTALGRIESSNVVGLLLNKGERASLLDGYGEYGYDAT